MERIVVMCSNDGRLWDIGFLTENGDVMKRLKVKNDGVQRTKDYKYKVLLSEFDETDLVGNIKKSL